MNSQANDIAIEVERLTKVYKGTRAVDELSFKISARSVTGLLGANGAGKTTTIGMILGLILPTSGTIRILGEDAIHNRQCLLHRINFESPDLQLPHRLTVRQNLRIFGLLYGVPSIERRIDELADDLELRDLLDRGPEKSRLGRRRASPWRKR